MTSLNGDWIPSCSSLQTQKLLRYGQRHLITPNECTHTNAVNDALLSQLERSQLVTVLCAALNKIMDELCLTEQEMTPLDREVRACCDCPQQLGTVYSSAVTC